MIVIGNWWRATASTNEAQGVAPRVEMAHFSVQQGRHQMEPHEMEYAMLKKPDGTVVPRPAAMRSLLKGLQALARAGGRVPHASDGSPMLWNEHRGWFPRDEARRAGRPLSELIARQRFRDHQLRQDRLDREIRADHELLRGASPLAWRWAQQFRYGFLPQPSLDAPAAEMTGWRLARRGYDSPPAWLLQEREDPGRGR